MTSGRRTRELENLTVLVLTGVGVEKRLTREVDQD